MGRKLRIKSKIGGTTVRCMNKLFGIKERKFACSCLVFHQQRKTDRQLNFSSIAMRQRDSSKHYSSSNGNGTEDITSWICLLTALKMKS